MTGNGDERAFSFRDQARVNGSLILAYTTGMLAGNLRRLGAWLRYGTILLAYAAPAVTQQGTLKTAASSIRVHGQATLSVDPDQVQFDIGVVTQATTPKAASDQNATQSNALTQQLSAAFPSASVKGINFSVNPNYEYPRDGPPKIAGYTASNTVRLLLNDISSLQTVIDIAINAGANSINRLSFTLRNENAVRAQALAGAANQALDGARALAAAMNLKLGRLVTVEEGQPVVVSPAREISFEKLQSTNLSPISAGTIEVHADVDLTYEAAPVPERSAGKVPVQRTPSKR